MKMMLSEFINKLELNPKSTKVTSLVEQLKVMLEVKGDIEIDMDHMCKALEIEI
jgi:hypothetical protein